MDEKKDVHPYNAVPQTRCGYYPKWVMTMSLNADGIVWRKLGHYVIKSSCLNHGNLQNLTMDGDAVPLPAEFCEVVDSLETWGAFHWVGWLEFSLHVMHECLKEDNMCGGNPPNEMRLFHDIILLHVQREPLFCFPSNSADYNRVLENWNTCFWVRCRETYSFHTLAMDSINCVEEMIRSIRSNRTPTPAASVAANDATLIPESPVSMLTYGGESTHE